LTLRRFPILEVRFLPSPKPPSSLSCPLVASSGATMIEVVEIAAGVNSEVPAEPEKVGVSIVWGENESSGEGGGTGWVTRINQECLDGGLLCMWVAVSL
jgi:hypothetical protein